jgi:hypothetical protein
MKFARAVYAIAAVYGLITLLPLYLLVERIGRDAPPPITHAEFYYGFVGLALLWQFVFLLIAKDPARYRSLMLLSIFEKAAYSVPVVVLYTLGKLSSSILWPALVDPIFGILFITAYFQTRDLPHR